MATTPHPDSAARTGRLARRRPAWLVILLCWLIVVFDGYDLIVYGTTIPPLLKEPGWRLTPAATRAAGRRPGPHRRVGVSWCLIG